MNFKLLRTLNGIMLLSLLFCASSYAQVKKITGKVTDGSDGGPIPGVNVSIKGKPSNVSTNADGIYTIQADPATDVLVFSYIGYTRQTISLTGRSTLNVALASSNADLDEVIVVGYGTKKKSEILGSVANIKAEDIQDLPVPNIAAALRNRLPGVGVNAVSGKPGSSITINIRNSTRSESAQLLGVTSEPLYVIDGITVTRDEFDNIDPTMVEDISFLKDASAAIYGASGAKGVVLVTTKKGRKGKPQISYTGFRGVSDNASNVDMLSAYDHAVLLNDGFRVANASASAFFSDADLELLKNNKIKGWFDELWKTSAVNRHNMNISGGSDAITFFAGGNYYDESGNYGGIKYSKYAFRSGMTAKIIDGLNATVTLNADFSKKTSDTYKNGGENDQAFFQQLITTPKWVPMQIDGKPVNYNNKTNPYGVMQAGNNIWDKSQGLALNASVDYKPKFIPGLTARVQFGKNNRSGNNNQYIPAYNVYNFQMTGNNSLLYTNTLATVDPVIQAISPANAQLLTGTSLGSSYQAIASLSYDKAIGKHNLNIMTAFDQSEGLNESLQVYWRNQVLENIDEYWGFDRSSFTLQNKSVFESVQRSYIGRLNYDYNKKYFVEAIARADASSNFAPGNRWGVFPSLGLGWAISEEEFFKQNVKFVNRLKVRANYGLVGESRVNARLWQYRYIVDPNGYLYNETLTGGANPSAMPNPDITWEKARTLNLGLDASLLDNKINFTYEFYHRYSYDAYDTGSNENFPMYAGFEAPTINYQQRTSWGSEFSIGYRTKLGTNWGISTDVMFGFSNNRIDRMFYNEFQLWDITYPDLKYQFGTDSKKYNSANYGLISKGMFRTQAEVDAFLNENPTYTINNKIPQVGWLYYEDTNGDGKITEKDQVPMFNNTNSFGVGFNVGVTYKTFSLSTNFVTRFGGKEFYDSKSKAPASTTVNVPAYWKDHWTPENPNAKFPRYDDASIGAGWNSDFWAVSGTMIRINSMTLTYKMPKSFLNKIGIADSRLVLTGNNLWTIINPLKYKDPYSSTIYDYPTLRTISLGLNVSL
ncbi:SusC/RagA family TonB-linked outer membrane protein [Pedobacter africanus]|uniref:TonB-linked outer membrane protein, SusC/RagA family n=1 Tax=Pedobacter africanus TaxID=151894 RepID=A0A1W1YV05_9SPHI|nr:TonB-dependent receptor [Pedobacter africanus]SMC39943.1 TonB-linked outer membrane protein, SusC/RagA family [Pedobacter africanus]